METETLELLSDICLMLLRAEPEEQRLIDAVTGRVREMAGVGCVGYFVADGESWKPRSVSGWTHEKVSKFPPSTLARIFKPALGGDVVMSNDITEHPDFDDDPIVGKFIRSYLAVPVFREGMETVRGTLLIANEEAGCFDDRTASLMVKVAEMLGVALLNAEQASELKKQREHERILIAELAHRVKNTLATIQSIAHHTARTARSTDDFKDKFMGRLSAIAVTHDLLTSTSWRRVNIKKVIEAEMRPYDIPGEPRWTMDGPPLMVGSAELLSTGMLIHELVTNAVKYGALSAPGGTIHMSWSVRHRVLRFEWRETGGPPVSVGIKPKGGFGTRLINGIVSQFGGKVAVDRSVGGMSYRFTFPVPRRAVATGPALRMVS